MRLSHAKSHGFGGSADYAHQVRSRGKHTDGLRSEWKPMLLGLIQEARGSLNIVLGALLWDPYRRALGNRQRLVGILQRNGRVDRRVVQEFVDRWTSGVQKTN